MKENYTILLASDSFKESMSAKKYSLSVLALTGRVGNESEVLFDKGIDAIFCIDRGMTTLEDALKKVKKNIEAAAENIIRLMNLM